MPALETSPELNFWEFQEYYEFYGFGQAHLFQETMVS